ncbi:hypothetical protein H6P81_003531 [Aristolochia fimbriata]|uniref:Uncharacterized protein n=1 Tax=Aristolochia fimbriata TaxID=158543 RepID=A0AAV7FD14_ARIFI|nr:hypothetical protein H6P81_003531 [Aristolochia fimbriata]
MGEKVVGGGGASAKANRVFKAVGKTVDGPERTLTTLPVPYVVGSAHPLTWRMATTGKIQMSSPTRGPLIPRRRPRCATLSRRSFARIGSIGLDTSARPANVVFATSFSGRVKRKVRGHFQVSRRGGQIFRPNGQRRSIRISTCGHATRESAELNTELTFSKYLFPWHPTN